MKKKLKKLQTGHEDEENQHPHQHQLLNHSRGDLSSSSSISRGQWERRLQTDIQMAKQALFDALSPEKSTPTNQFNLIPSNFSKSTSSSSTYASNADNIAKLLKGWVKNSPKSSSTTSTTPTNSISNNFANESTTTSGDTNKSTQQHHQDNNSYVETLPETYELLFGLESLESTSSDLSQSMSPNESTAAAQMSLLEKWLCDDQQGKDNNNSYSLINDINLDDHTHIF